MFSAREESSRGILLPILGILCLLAGVVTLVDFKLPTFGASENLKKAREFEMKGDLANAYFHYHLEVDRNSRSAEALEGRARCRAAMVAEAKSHLVSGSFETRVPDAVLTCILEVERDEIAPGENPGCRVRIKNVSQMPVMVVGFLDGSDDRTRMPYCVYEIEGPPQPTNTPGLSTCGFEGGSRPPETLDFVTLEPGEEFDPFRKPSSGKKHPAVLAADMPWPWLRTPGTYTVRFSYSTASNDLQHWFGNARNPGEDEVARVVKLLETVPLVTIQSNPVTLVVSEPGTDGSSESGNQRSGSPLPETGTRRIRE